MLQNRLPPLKNFGMKAKIKLREAMERNEMNRDKATKKAEESLKSSAMAIFKKERDLV